MNGVHKLIILLGSFASSYVDGSEQCHISIASSVYARHVFWWKTLEFRSHYLLSISIE
jgi:hypothetical protein